MDAPDLIGKQLGSYEVQALIGSGGMSHVYRGLDQNLQRLVAIKVLSQAAAAQPGFVERFRQEARMLAGLHHPHIVQIYNFGQQDSSTYMVQELLPGPTLEQYLQNLALRGRWIGRQDIVSIISQLASALDVAHAAGIVHRDVKPNNALWNMSGALVLTDFGIARHMLTERGQLRTAWVIGTPGYLSPEQARGLPGTQASDIYALGIVAYELIAGRVPFTGSTPATVIRQHIEELPPPLRTLRPQVLPAVEEVVQRALAKDPAERFASAGEFSRALRRAWPPTPGSADHLLMGSSQRQASSFWAEIPGRIALKAGSKYNGFTSIHSRTTVCWTGDDRTTATPPPEQVEHVSSPAAASAVTAPLPLVVRWQPNQLQRLVLLLATLLLILILLSTVLALHDDYQHRAGAGGPAQPTAVPTAHIIRATVAPLSDVAIAPPAVEQGETDLVAPTALGDVPPANQFAYLRRLLSSQSGEAWMQADPAGWLSRLDEIEQAMATGDSSHAAARLDEMRQMLLQYARDGMINPDLAQQMIMHIDSIAASSNISLPPVAIPIADDG